jgi:hypothetical protein
MEANGILKKHFPNECEDIANESFNTLRDAIEALNIIFERENDQNYI